MGFEIVNLRLWVQNSTPDSKMYFWFLISRRIKEEAIYKKQREEELFQQKFEVRDSVISLFSIQFERVEMFIFNGIRFQLRFS